MVSGRTVRKLFNPRRRSVKQLNLSILTLIIVVLVAAFFMRNDLPTGDKATYPTIFMLNVISSATFFVPLPAVASVCIGGALLNPMMVALVSGLGGTLGEITGYLVGYSGRGIVQKSRIYNAVKSWLLRRGWVALFLFAAIPVPIFDFAGIAAGMLRFPLWKFFGAVLPGKILKYLGMAYLCSWGYDVMQVLQG
jgi:membrane protein YqaA with SNARE-associated domain